MPDVPYIAQSESLCGGAAATMLLRYWGDRETRAGDFRPLVSGRPAGISNADLVAELRRDGWRVRLVSPDLGGIAEHLRAGRPVLALQRVRPDRYHYVVLLAVTENRVLLHDPARGPYRVVERDEWTDDWAAADRWAAVVLPGDPDGARESRTGSARGTPARGEAAQDLAPGCAALVRRGVAAAREGETASARTALRAATDLCSGRAEPWRELAGLSFRERELDEAERLASRAATLPGSGEYAWRLLGSSRYLNGDHVGALRAWNRVGAPAVARVRIEGLTRTRHQPALRLIGLPPDTILTPDRLTTARRRLMELPALRRARVDYRALEGDRVAVRVAAWERRMPTASPAAVATLAVRSLAERTVEVALPSPVGQGGLVSAAWRWSSGRPRLRLAVEIPAPPGWGARWGARGWWERQTYRSEVASASPATGEEDGGWTEERRRASLSVAEWLSSSFRGVLSAGVDRFSGAPAGGGTRSYLGGAAGVSWHSPRGRWSGRARVRYGVPVATGRSSFRTVALGLTGRLGRAGSSTTVRATAGVRRASDGAPLAYWPGAGTGRGREMLLRAHPLVRDGRIAGPAFGRSLAHASVDATRWLLEAGPIRGGVAGFVDAAGASSRPVDWPGRAAHVDLGAGVRIRAGDRGTLRLDAAVGAVDREVAFSAGWFQHLPVR